MAILVYQNIYLTTIIYSLHLAICTQWSHYKLSNIFPPKSESVEISFFTSLYNLPTELSPSPRGPNPLKAGYLSFQ